MREEIGVLHSGDNDIFTIKYIQDDGKEFNDSDISDESQEWRCINYETNGKYQSIYNKIEEKIYAVFFDFGFQESGLSDIADQDICQIPILSKEELEVILIKFEIIESDREKVKNIEFDGITPVTFIKYYSMDKNWLSEYNTYYRLSTLDSFIKDIAKSLLNNFGSILGKEKQNLESLIK